MIQNHFASPLFADIAKQILGLEFFTLDDIRSLSYRSDIQEGDFYLQYRRPAVDVVPTRGSFGEEHRKKLPAIILQEGLDHPDVGFLPKRAGTGTAFRMFRVTHSARNEHRTYFECEAFYSIPRYWGVPSGSRGGQDRAWRDKRSSMSWRGSAERKFTLRDSDRDPTYPGIIGKFDRSTIYKYFRSSGNLQDQTFHALFRALQSNEPYRPSVVDAIRESAEELGIEIVSNVL